MFPKSTLVLIFTTLFCKSLVSLAIEVDFPDYDDEDDTNDIDYGFVDDQQLATGEIYDEFPIEEGPEHPPIMRGGTFLLSSLPYIHKLLNMKPESLKDRYPIKNPTPLKEYDFVVIGAGSAGSAIASRLSEVKNWTVLLLEAGGPEMLFSDIPVFAHFLQGTDYNWGDKLEPSEGSCLGMANGRCSWPRGKAIGGSSVINYMIYTRGNKIDWDRIAAAGNPGWAWDDVLPYFLKSEKANLKGLRNSPFHSRDGLLSIEYANYRSPITKKIMKAARETGHKFVDYNAGSQLGFSYVQTHTRSGVRNSAARAYLYPFRKRKNLHLYPFTRVTKININPTTKIAESVEFVRNRIKYTVRARKEIILSAGALNSPQILMLSGVGPKKHLDELGIDVIKDSPVGQTMYDHACFVGLAFMLNVSRMGLLESEVTGDLQNLIDWLRHGEGPGSVIGAVEAMGYIRTNVSQDEAANLPDVEFMFVSSCIGGSETRGMARVLNIDDEFFTKAYGRIEKRPCWSLFPMLLHPKSKGRMELADRNPFSRPKFYYDYFADRRDLDAMVEGIKYAVKLAQAPTLRKYGSVLHDEPYPGCESWEFGSDEYWQCAARALAASIYHQMGTCPMGPTSDPDAVVDHELRVHGVKRLRVGDASVFPRPIGAHLNAPSIVVGEKLSDMVKRAWGQ